VKCYHGRDWLPERERAKGAVQNIDSVVSRLCRKRHLLPNLKAVAWAIKQINRPILNTGRFVKRQVGSVGKETPTNLAGTCEFRYYTGKVVPSPPRTPRV